jgi:hypothetical protein
MNQPPIKQSLSPLRAAPTVPSGVWLELKVA